MESVTPLQRAVNEVGNQTLLAKMIGRKQSTVWEWLRRGWPAPDACHAIEAATGGKVKAAELLAPAMQPRPATKRKRTAA